MSIEIITSGEGKISEVSKIKGTEKELKYLFKFIKDNVKVIKFIEIMHK